MYGYHVGIGYDTAAGISAIGWWPLKSTINLFLWIPITMYLLEIGHFVITTNLSIEIEYYIKNEKSKFIGHKITSFHYISKLSG